MNEIIESLDITNFLTDTDYRAARWEIAMQILSTTLTKVLPWTFAIAVIVAIYKHITEIKA